MDQPDTSDRRQIKPLYLWFTLAFLGLVVTYPLALISPNKLVWIGIAMLGVGTAGAMRTHSRSVWR